MVWPRSITATCPESEPRPAGRTTMAYRVELDVLDELDPGVVATHAAAPAGERTSELTGSDKGTFIVRRAATSAILTQYLTMLSHSGPGSYLPQAAADAKPSADSSATNVPAIRRRCISSLGGYSPPLVALSPIATDRPFGRRHA